MELGTTLVPLIEAFELALVVETSSAKPHLMIRPTKRIPTAKTTTSQPSRHTTGMMLHHTKHGASTSTWFLTDKFESCEVSMSKNQSVSERLFIHMSIATDRPAILTFVFRSLRPKPSATKDDVKVAEIIETGKKICTFATNSNNYDINRKSPAGKVDNIFRQVV